MSFRGQLRRWGIIPDGAGSQSVEGSLTAATGITATAGGVTATAGGVTATAGGVTATAGGVTATAGDITAAADDIVATLGDVIIDAGALTVTLGDVGVAAGDIDVTLGDVDIAAGDLNLVLGDGFIRGQLRVNGPIVPWTEFTTDATAGVINYTAAMLIGGWIMRDPAGAGRADTIDTAANIIAAITGMADNDYFDFIITNTASGAETITVTTNTGLTLVGTMTIAQNESKSFRAIMTGAGAVSIYNMGVFTT